MVSLRIYSLLKEIIELPSICFKDENSHDYECHYSELVDKLTSYLVLDTANHFKRKLQINCVLGKERSLEHPYILISLYLHQKQFYGRNIEFIF